MHKRIVISGGTGLIGSAIIKKLEKDFEFVIISRRPSIARPDIKSIALNDISALRESINGSYAVINLAGASIAGKKWTDKYKKTIYDSRINTTKNLADIVNECEKPPEKFISTSAVGYYGNVDEERVTETSPAGNDFLARVCIDWEKQAYKCNKKTNVIITRIGVVLDKDEGALPEMAKPFKFFAGAWPGSGKQWVPWIHIEDIAELFAHVVKSDDYGQVYNFTAPVPERMKQLVKNIGDVLGRPALMPAPKFAIKLMLGEGASMVLNGQKALPQQALSEKFQFKFNESYNAIENLLKD